MRTESLVRAHRNAKKWIKSNCWLASFDILGFRNLMSIHKEDTIAHRVCIDYEITIENLKESCPENIGHLDYCWFSDTFLIFTPDDTSTSYCVIQSAAKRFIENCISSYVPIRGAISVGPFMRTEDNRSFIGKAFLDAYEYSGDQDWLGLLLTPTAIKKVEAYGLSLIYDFILSEDIPMRKFSNKDVMAYRFQNGAANIPSIFLPKLREMKSISDEKHGHKYERAIQWIEKNYRWLE
jgi:hypothetical protein